MSRLLLVNRKPDQRRAVLIENGLTTELFFERLRQRSLVGNLYLGRVVRVLRGMQAAFVEVGLARTGFLFVGDVAVPESDRILDGDDSPNAPPPGGRGEKYPPINQLLTQGQTVLVQISKAPMGTKGARLTTHISLPGRHLVFLPTVHHVGVSRRIPDVEERERLRDIAQRIKPEVGGLIIRTVGEGASEEEFVDDLAFLQQLWAEIQRRAKVASAPSLVHEDLDLTLRSIRDLIQSDEDRVVVDDDVEMERILDFVRRFMPGFAGSVQRWDSQDNMLERYGVEWEISRASRRKIWLKSGGYIIIDRTEALTAIDVNTGRYTGKTANFEDTIVDINLEAVREIAYQLRLRDIGGIIVIDFIDMEREENKEQVAEALKTELARDRARSKVLPMSGFGLIEMTRKRVRHSIVQELTESCFYCDGKGYLRSGGVIADSIISQLHQQLRRGGHGAAEVQAHPRITELLITEYQEELSKIEARYQVRLDLVDEPARHLEQFQVQTAAEPKD